jgi:hypothetical protein
LMTFISSVLTPVFAALADLFMQNEVGHPVQPCWVPV